MYPPTVKHARETEFAVSVARALVGAANVYDKLEPLMGSEDFAFMLEERPGNVMLIGNGDTASVHDARYDFNDEAIPFGIAYFRNIVERGLCGLTDVPDASRRTLPPRHRSSSFCAELETSYGLLMALEERGEALL